MREKIALIMCVLLITNIYAPISFALGIRNLTSEHLNSISMTSENSGWMVGNRGTILRYGGGSWSIVESPTTEHLHDVDMVTWDDGWAVGYNTLLHYDGMLNTWSDETFRIDAAPGQNEYWDLYEICMIDSSDGWAVGRWGRTTDYRSEFSALLLHWNGEKWRLVTTFGSMPPLWDISMIDSSTGLAVGGGNDFDYNVYRWNGASWTGEVVGSAGGTIAGVFVVSDTSVWATNPNAAPEGLYHWDGTKWTTTSVGIYNDEWRHAVLSLFFLDDNSGWASGYLGSLPSDISDKRGTMLRWDGTLWEQIGDFLPVAIYAFHFSDENNGWAVGAEGTILRWDGNSWKVYASTAWPQPFWSQLWFWAVIAIVIGATFVAVISLRRRKQRRMEIMRHNTKVEPANTSLLAPER